MLKNYTSSASLPSIFNEIEKTLTTHGAKQVIRDYNGSGKIVAISFVIAIKSGQVAIRLPARTEKVKQIFDNQGIRYKEDQPYRTAWATIRDWISSQMALIDWEMVKLEEVFLPYAIDRSGNTYFEVIEQRGFSLGSGEKETQK